jgi:hypothetical protein
MPIVKFYAKNDIMLPNNEDHKLQDLNQEKRTLFYIDFYFNIFTLSEFLR